MAATGIRVPLAISGAVIALLVGIGILNYGDTVTVVDDDGGETEQGVDAPDGAVPLICLEKPDDGGTTCYYCPVNTVPSDGSCVPSYWVE